MTGDFFSLYFHIPFCTKKCDYCHFYVIPNKAPFHKQLMEGFFLEWERQKSLFLGKQLKTVYFGGGTPALIGPQAIEHILSMIFKDVCCGSDLEITLEANPENISFDLMKSYRKAGINRVSIGMQTLDQELLPLLGRLHSSEKAKESVAATFDAGISNISIDLMYDLPRQSLDSFEKTVKEAVKLPITHLSLYNLTFEPKTVFFKHRERLKAFVPSQETSLKMYQTAIYLLEESGLKQYEISAFAKPGMESKHNTGYWTGRPFLGFGPSAFSYWKRKRFSNVSHLGKYLAALKQGNSPVDFEETLSTEDSKKELLAVRLRLLEGIHIKDFEADFGFLSLDTKQTLDRLKQEGLLKEENGKTKLSEQGILFYDSVAADLI